MVICKARFKTLHLQIMYLTENNTKLFSPQINKKTNLHVLMAAPNLPAQRMISIPRYFRLPQRTALREITLCVCACVRSHLKLWFLAVFCESDSAQTGLIIESWISLNCSRAGTGLTEAEEPPRRLVQKRKQEVVEIM